MKGYAEQSSTVTLRSFGKDSVTATTVRMQSTCTSISTVRPYSTRHVVTDGKMLAIMIVKRTIMTVCREKAKVLTIS